MGKPKTYPVGDWSSTIVCIRVQWNHSDLSECTPKGGVLAGRLLESSGGIKRFQALSLTNSEANM